MAIVDVDGTASGVGGTSVGPQIIHDFGGTLQGSGTVAPATLYRTMLFGGQVDGQGVIEDQLTINVAGATGGQATAVGDFVRIRGISGITGGQGAFLVSVPEPIFGIGTIAAYMEVIHVPPPACAVCSCPKAAFKWMQDFQKGDLEICITNRMGMPIGPYSVTYTLYWVQRGCTPHQVGCCGRTPAKAGFGKYYVTGTAGEGGQPGLWLVRWKVQETFGGPYFETDQCFEVQDAIAAGDKTPRYCKYGWGD